jgi:hypothetical protein
LEKVVESHYQIRGRDCAFGVHLACTLGALKLHREKPDRSSVSTRLPDDGDEQQHCCLCVCGIRGRRFMLQNIRQVASQQASSDFCAGTDIWDHIPRHLCR